MSAINKWMNKGVVKKQPVATTDNATGLYNSSTTYHVCRSAGGQGCTFPAGCLLVCAGTCQKDDFLATPHSKTHNQQRRYQQCRSAREEEKSFRAAHTSLSFSNTYDHHDRDPIHLRLTGLSLQSSPRTSGAIQPSVPGTPDLLLKLWWPTASFLHKPKSEIMARTRPCALGIDTRMLWGFRSLWTEGQQLR